MTSLQAMKLAAEQSSQFNDISMSQEEYDFLCELRSRWESGQLVEKHMSPWQPIETAPKDATKVDLWSAHAGRIVDAEWCNSSPLYPDGHWVRDILSPGETDLEWYNPTHWMRPPEAPKEDDQ